MLSVKCEGAECLSCGKRARERASFLGSADEMSCLRSLGVLSVMHG